MTSGDGHDKSDDPLSNDSNVIPLKVPRQKAVKPPEHNKDREPLINLPRYTKYMLGTIILIHLGITFLLNDEQRHWVFLHLGLIPGRFTGNALFDPFMFITPLTHMLLHGSWLHIAMNAVMLLAFGSGVEKWIGGPKMIIFFILCGLCGVATHFVLNYDSIYPVIGASGGLSGLFAAALTMMNRQHHGMTGKYGIWPFIILWIGISVVFGLMGLT